MKRKKFIQISTLGISSALVPSTIFQSCIRAKDKSTELFNLFSDPPTKARPFVRWWWNGNRVDEKEILRELDILNESGIGGVEINPIAMPKNAKNVGQKSLDWLSPKWNHMIKVAAEGAQKRGMLTDMLVGTGWPFGGRFIPPKDQIKGVVFQKFHFKGPKPIRYKLEEIVEIKNKPDAEQKAPSPQVLFLRISPTKINNINEIKDLTDQINSEGVVEFKVPKGDYILFLGTVQTGINFQTVKFGAPGAEGPCLDHYNKEAVKKYLNHISDKIGPEMGGALGNTLRSMFVDSIELSGADWTNDMLEQFRKRRGYDLVPYYPFVFYNSRKRYDNPLKINGSLIDTIKRVRYDFNRTLVELYTERFVKTFTNWCQQQNIASRYQAYGAPWLMGMHRGYMIPDIPESNNWLFSQKPYHQGYNVWTKYASAGAHLSDKSVTSSEAMTNTRGVFKTTLEMIKQADDMNFIMGINHSVLHGFNYSPPEAGFPGWVRFGTYFSAQNTWWPYFHHWVDYNARLSSIFQHSQPIMDIAILTPKADMWSKSGLHRVDIQTEPWYGHRLWEPIHQNGLTADYISESIIQKSTKSKGTLKYGPMAYETLILTGVQTLLPETAKAIQDFAEVGGRVIFIDEQPNRSPSLENANENDDIVQRNIQKTINKNSSQTKVVDPPGQKENLHIYMKNLINAFNIEQPVQISRPDPALYQMRQQKGDKDIFFFVNNDNTRMQSFTASFKTGDKIPWKWNPMTGKRQVYPYRDTKKRLNIRLQPLESLLLVFEKDLEGTNKIEGTNKQEKDAKKAVDEVEGPWHCKFQHAQRDSFSRTLTKLVDLSQSPDPQLHSFAGSILYQSSFNTGKNGPQILDLSEVQGVAEVSLNGTPLGTEWWGQRQYNIADIVERGENKLEVKVTIPLYNYIKSLKGNDTAQRWVNAQDDEHLIPAGLLGPVKVITLV